VNHPNIIKSNHSKSEWYSVSQITYIPKLSQRLPVP
jgi:hypothetical protein